MRKLTKLRQLPIADLLLAAAAIRTLPFATVSRLQWPAPARRRNSPAARALLRAHGASANLRLGVTKTATGQLQAHAWLECQGRIVLGGFSALRRYTALADFEP